MLKLSEIYQKDAVCDTENLENCQIAFDNLLRKFYFCSNQGICSVQKINVAEKIKIFGAEWLSDAPQCLCTIKLGQNVYDTNGTLLGTMEEAEFTSKLQLKKFLVGEKKFVKSDVWCVGKDALLIKVPSAKQIAAKNKATAVKPPQQPQTAPHPQQATAEQVSEPAAPTKQPTPHRSRRKYGDFGFLVGKTVDKTVSNFQGEIMIKKGEIVTRDILRQAKISGKLIELYLHIE